jgi:hypothetical protein
VTGEGEKLMQNRAAVNPINIGLGCGHYVFDGEQRSPYNESANSALRYWNHLSHPKKTTRSIHDRDDNSVDD